MGFCRIYITLLLFAGLFTSTISRAYGTTNIPAIELKDVEIVSAFKEKEPAFKSAASVFVLSSDDIRRSGATNIPEALRLVPGIEVGRASSGDWSVTSRGFGRLYDNKVLVLIDGREFYSSVFTGTNWDITDVILDDIDRIEVIRGVSSTLWGANTLNGVINIITKEAKYTQGNLATVLYGNQEKGLEYRYGGNAGNNLFYRVYAKKTEREDLKSIDNLRGDQYQDAGDSWVMSKAGFRVDWLKTLRDSVTIQGDLNDGYKNRSLFIPTIESNAVHDKETINGFNIDTKWNHNINDTDNFVLHFYIDDTSRKSLLGSINRQVLNLDSEYHLKAGKNNKLKLGLGYRYTEDSLKNGYVNNILVNQYDPQNEKINLYTAFIQDTYSIIPEKLDFIFGSKFEHHYITGSQYMPSTQLRWTPNEENTLWASVSKGIREPSRLETSLRRLTANLGPYKIYWQSNSDFKAEEMLSYEVGYRNRSLSRIELDISAFRNEYDNVRTFEPNFQKLQYELFNRAEARTYGVNTSVNLAASNNWNLTFGYSYIDLDINFDNNSADTLSQFDAGVSPRHQFQIQSRLNITKDIDFDTGFYYVDALKTVNIESYYRTDLRLAYRPIKNLELSIVGQKMFYPDTRETTRSFYSTHNATLGNQVYGKIKLQF